MNTSLDEMREERKHALVDILYLMNVTCLYITSLVCFPVGIVFGIILRLGSHSDKAKRIGLTALVLGLIGLGLFILFSIVLIVMGVISIGWPW